MSSNNNDRINALAASLIRGVTQQPETKGEMNDEQLAMLNKALGLAKNKNYRPYCLRCSGPTRVKLIPQGFECPVCHNTFGFDLKPLPNA